MGALLGGSAPVRCNRGARLSPAPARLATPAVARMWTPAARGDRFSPTSGGRGRAKTGGRSERLLLAALARSASVRLFLETNFDRGDVLGGDRLFAAVARHGWDAVAFLAME